MKKIVILLDEWKNNKNFIFNELDDLQKYFEIVIVHNDSKIECEDCNSNIKFVSYDVNKKRRLVKSVLNCIFDIEVYREILNMYNSEEASYLAKIVEIIKFYIKAELFYYFLKSEGLIINDENMVYYSYWNFYKCYAITKHKNEIIK
ncbi:MAG: hypothetical protein Q4D29_11290 [Lachnospiraceae bacterium]|nr:hypothetical protein [Lachnospiraceae bacterium]